MSKTKTINLYREYAEGSTCNINCVINRNGVFKNRSNTLIHSQAQKTIYYKRTPRYKRHLKERQMRQRSLPASIELFPLQSGCVMHHINSTFTVPCLTFIHEQPHVRGDLFLEGWV